MKIEWSKVITSKTVWLGIFTIGLSVVQFVSSQPEGTSVATLVIGIMIIFIRFLTVDKVVK